ncbi:hypothetical protein [Kitasatospora brasiliensis]|uniref:hypothetical protein n=1 Tax=Kitasatospora brasiliensis TaxID=3058040 RepID=UPI00292E9744|nr:hypothetical protein [Kitasatospora sp. K002]
MARYELLQTKLKTGEVVASLPATAISYTETLNQAGTATFMIPLNPPQASPAKLFPAALGSWWCATTNRCGVEFPALLP